MHVLWSSLKRKEMTKVTSSWSPNWWQNMLNHRSLSLILGFWCHCRNFAEKGCLLSRFHFPCCRYFLGHVACWNLPWQGLWIVHHFCRSFKWIEIIVSSTNLIWHEVIFPTDVFVHSQEQRVVFNMQCSIFHCTYATHWHSNPSSMQDVCPMNLV